MTRWMASAIAAGLAFGTLAAPPPPPAAPPLEPRVIDPPAPPGALAPALATEGSRTVSQHHDLLMTWLEPETGGGRLRFSRWTGDAWSRPVTLADGVALPEVGDGASLTVIETQAVRRTLLARTGDVLVRSGDGGRGWSRLPGPTLPFSSFAGAEDGGFAYWLQPQNGGTASLLGTRVLSGESVLDPSVVPRSPTSAALTWDGPVVVYRDLETGGACDVALVRRENGFWTAPIRVTSLPAPAVQGPRVAARERLVAVAWTTGQGRDGRVLIAFSTDAGRSFAAPIEVAGAERGVTPETAVALALDAAGQALVLWQSAGQPVQVARVAPDGRLGESLELSPAASGSQPQLVLAGDQLAASWLEGSPGRVRARSLPLAALPALGSRRPRPQAAIPAPRAAVNHGRVGDLVPNQEVTSLAGRAVSLPDLAGRTVVLNLWATWCLPCLAEMPELGKVQHRYRKDGLLVLGLNVDTSEAEDRVRALVAERKMPFEIWLDPEMKIYRALRVRTLPTTLVLDPTGKILWRRDQAITADDPGLREAIERALGGR